MADVFFEKKLCYFCNSAATPIFGTKFSERTGHIKFCNFNLLLYFISLENWWHTVCLLYRRFSEESALHAGRTGIWIIDSALYAMKQVVRE